MNRKTRRALGIAAVLILVLLAMSQMTGTQDPQRPSGTSDGTPGGITQTAPAADEETSSVVTATVNIPKQRKIRPEMIKLTKVPVSLRHTDAATDTKQVIDHFSLVGIFEKEQILLQRLGESSSADVGMSYVIQRGKRAVSLPIRTENAVGGYISPGMLVDILGSFRAATGVITKPVLQRVKILAINDKYIIEKTTGKPPPKAPEPGKEAEAQKSEGFQQIDNIQTVTFEVSPDEAEKLLLSSANAQLFLQIVNQESGAELPPGEVSESDVREFKRPVTTALETPIATAPVSDQPQQPVIHQYEIIRYTTKEMQTVAENPLTSQTAQVTTTGTASSGGAPTTSK